MALRTNDTIFFFFLYYHREGAAFCLSWLSVWNIPKIFLKRTSWLNQLMNTIVCRISPQGSDRTAQRIWIVKSNIIQMPCLVKTDALFGGQRGLSLRECGPVLKIQRLCLIRHRWDKQRLTCCIVSEENTRIEY